MDWLEIVKAGADLGFIVLCAGFVLWLVRDMYIRHKKNASSMQSKIDEKEKENQKKDDEIIQSLQSKTDELYNIIIEYQKKTDERYQELVKQLLDSIHEPHILSDEENSRMTKIDMKIDELLERALESCQASRVHLVKYHNGGNDMLGNSILKMSMSNEKCSAGVIHILNSFQNQLRTSFAYWIKELNETNYCYIEDVEDIKDIDSSIYQYMKQTGIQAKYGAAIKNTQTDSVIGYLCIDFLNKNDANLDQIRHCLNDKKAKIETLLNLGE